MPRKVLGRVAARNLLRGFWRRHPEVVEFIENYDEGFWIDLEDVAREVQRAVYTTEGAVVREGPTTRDIPVQTRVEDRIEVATQTGPGPRTTERATSPRGGPRSSSCQAPRDQSPRSPTM